MKKKNKIILMVMASIVLLGTWSYIKEIDIKPDKSNGDEIDDQDIVRGKFIKSTGTANYLFDWKTLYIEDDSAVGKLLDALDIGLYGHYTFELKTSKKPYVLVINYSQVEGWGNILNKPEITLEKSAILLALIDNVDEIHWIAENKTNKITVSDFNANYGNIKDYGKTVKDLKGLLRKLGYYKEDEPITISIKDEKLTNTELTLIIKNHTNNNYLYGEPFSIEREENGKWVAIDPLVDNCAFIMIGYTLKAEQEIEKKENWEHCNGKLPKGQYRITKAFRYMSSDTNNVWNEKKYIVSAEFSI